MHIPQPEGVDRVREFALDRGAAQRGFGRLAVDLSRRQDLSRTGLQIELLRRLVTVTLAASILPLRFRRQTELKTELFLEVLVQLIAIALGFGPANIVRRQEVGILDILD